MTPINLEVLVVTIAKLSEAVKANQLVGFDAGPAGVDEPVMGVAKYAAEAGQPVAVIVQGLVELTAATNIAAGDYLYSNVDGRPTDAGTNHPFGIAFQGGAAGDVISVLLK